MAYGRLGRDFGCHLAHLRPADGGSEVTLAQQETQALWAWHEAQYETVAQRSQTSGVFGAHAVFQSEQADRAVQRTGIDVAIPQGLGQQPARRAFSRTGRAVNSDDESCFHGRMMVGPVRSRTRL